jgi:hypothetical protein
MILTASRRSTCSGQPARLGKVARHFGGCGPVQGNEGATHVQHPPAARGRATRQRSPPTTGTRRASEPGSRLADLGAHGFDRHETGILAALVTEHPLVQCGVL